MIAILLSVTLLAAAAVLTVQSISRLDTASEVLRTLPVTPLSEMTDALDLVTDDTGPLMDDRTRIGGC